MLILKTINEGLKELDYGCYYTDYVGDIANWLVNKPKEYRMVYYAPDDVWGISDAMTGIHADVLISMIEGGIVDVTKDGYDDWDDAFNSGDCIRFVFMPNGKEDEINWRYTKNIVKLETGTLVPEHRDDIKYGGGKELYDKLVSMGAVKAPAVAESLRIDEGLKRLECKNPRLAGTQMYYTDYYGDIATALVNKPKPYRIIYYAPEDVWCICDAHMTIHGDLVEGLDSAGIISLKDDGYLGPYDAMMDDDAVIAMMFVPHGVEKEFSNRFFYRINLSSGILGFEDKEYADKPAGKELLGKLKIMGALEDSVNESLQLREGLKPVEYRGLTPMYYSDYAGDIANWLINKPKPYRILYDSKHDIWCIADALGITHTSMAALLYDTGIAGLTPEEQAYVDEETANLRKYGAIIKPSRVWLDMGFNDDWITGCMFLPYESDFEDEGTDFYRAVVPTETGDLLFRSTDEFDYGPFHELKDVLENRGALPERDVLY